MAIEKFRKIAIFGQYKTGTTALFYKIKNSITSKVRTLFEPVEYIEEAGDADRFVLAKVILGIPEDSARVKYDTFMTFDKKLYLVRDPRDWLVSGTLFLIQQESGLYNDEEKLSRVMEMLRQKESDPKSISLLKIFEQVLLANPDNSLERTTEWMKRQYQWFIKFESHIGDHLIIRYEDFVDGRVEEMESYLEMPLGGSSDVAEKHSHVPRTKSYGNWKDWFLEEDVAHFKPLFCEYIERHGYSNEWRLNDDPIVRAEHCSEYVERVVKKRKSRSNC